jgi:predicted negative regulator of RcsB-dependent stress response
MARHPSSRRVPHAPDEDDAFVARVLEFTAWSKKNARAILIGGAVVAAVVLGMLFYAQHRRAQEDRAAAQFDEIRQTVMAGNRALAMRDLTGLVGRFGGTEAGREGRMLLGRMYLEEGNPQEAVAAVAPLARDPAKPLGPAAAELLAAAYEAGGDIEAAVQVHLRVADRARLQYTRRNALEAAAELRLAAGDPAEAARIYERLLAALPEDADERGVFEMRLAEARARAGH